VSISSKGSSMEGTFLPSISAHSNDRPCPELGIFCDAGKPCSSPREPGPWEKRPLKQ
jgi:hypothetical protein